MNTVAIIQARMGSSRLPGKMLTDLGGKPVLAWVVDAARAIQGVDKVVVATSDAPADKAISDWCESYGVTCHTGPEDDVLSRFTLAAKAENAGLILRLTGDCPLLDPQVCAQVLLLLKRSGGDYASNAEPPSWPDGLDCEAFTRQALDKAAANASRQSDREHVTPYMRSHRQMFEVASLTCPLPGLGHERWTLDDARDLEFLDAVVARLDAARPPAFTEVLAVLERDPGLRALNTGPLRNDGYKKSRKADRADTERDYAVSWRMLEDAERYIPLGSQTFSKSRVQYPENQAPLFLTHGQGGHVWDVDGNEYVDMVCGLLSVSLGYRDPEVDAAIRSQLDRGISFSLATELETRLARDLVNLIPCAEKVRFGKNGSDATSAVIRVARAATGRDRVIVCGYHGWQDWYIGSTSRHKGVPVAVRELTHPVAFGDLDAVDRLLSAHRGAFAVMILEPAGIALPPEGYLAGLKDLLHEHGALLAFDETITGFRYAAGGAQEYFGVTPDLASFGKGMGNGMPISAVVGRADLMNEMEEIFYSATFGGETLSIAAAIAVIEKIISQPVIEHYWQTGEALAAGLGKRIAATGLDQVMAVVGAAPWSIIAINDHPAARQAATRTFFIREMLRHGVLTLGTHNICYAHDQADVDTVLAAYDSVLPALAESLATGDLEAALPCPVIEPIFQVRPS
jgi:glutamate-1-semialdehyde 2,1-aminomutase/spore coat polysaccharide biosynthesis protein SpsF